MEFYMNELTVLYFYGTMNGLTRLDREVGILTNYDLSQRIDFRLPPNTEVKVVFKSDKSSCVRMYDKIIFDGEGCVNLYNGSESLYYDLDDLICLWWNV